MKKTMLFHCNISTGYYGDFVQKIVSLAQNRISTSIFVANVHMLIETLFDPFFCKLFNDADIVTPDGKPLCFALQFLYGIQQERVAGMDLMPSLLEEAAKKGISVYFYGSTNDVLEKIKNKCQIQYPSLKIAGMYSPPFRSQTKDEELFIVNQINDSGAGIVFVALGCPKQEKWVSSMKGYIHAVLVGVGGAFPVFADAQKRAPIWMQDASLEWLYRLKQEPRRLFKRYLVTNSIFVYMLLKEKWRLNKFVNQFL